MAGTQRPSLRAITYPPPVYTRENWYEIDADGYVTRMLTTDRDAGGNVIQQGAMVANYSIN